MEYYLPIKKEISTICNNMDGPWQYYANKSERQIPYSNFMWNLKEVREQIGGYQRGVGKGGKWYGDRW